VKWTNVALALFGTFFVVFILGMRANGPASTQRDATL